MRYRFKLLALLLGVVLAFVAPAQAGADDGINCIEDIVFDPTYCDDDPEPIPPPPPRRMNPERGGMQEMPGGPGMRPGTEGEVCPPERIFADPAFIFETGQPRTKIYDFTLRINFCTRNGIVTRASVIPGLELEPFDSRIQSFTQPALFIPPTGVGTSEFRQAQDVLTELACPGLTNCDLYRHTIFVSISGPTGIVNVDADLFPCRLNGVPTGNIC